MKDLGMLSSRSKYMNFAKGLLLLLNTWSISDAAEMLGLDESKIGEMAQASDFNEESYGAVAEKTGIDLSSPLTVNKSLKDLAIRKVLSQEGVNLSLVGRVQLRTDGEPGRIPSKREIMQAVVEVGKNMPQEEAVQLGLL